MRALRLIAVDFEGDRITATWEAVEIARQTVLREGEVLESENTLSKTYRESFSGHTAQIFSCKNNRLSNLKIAMHSP